MEDDEDLGCVDAYASTETTDTSLYIEMQKVSTDVDWRPPVTSAKQQKKRKSPNELKEQVKRSTATKTANNANAMIVNEE